MTQNVFISSLKYIFVEVIFDILYFPIWWYTKGLVRITSYCAEKLVGAARRLALRIWLKHMFTPMYGDYTKEGRIISFLMRIIVLIFKLVMILFWAVYVFVVFILWLTIPLLFIYFILFQIFNLPFFDRLL